MVVHIWLVYENIKIHLLFLVLNVYHRQTFNLEVTKYIYRKGEREKKVDEALWSQSKCGSDY